MVYIHKAFPALRLHRSDWRLSRREILRHLHMGLPMGFQSSIIAIGSLMLQYALNSLGSTAVAAFTAANKLESLGTLPLGSFGLAMGTFVAQNYGAGTRILKYLNGCLDDDHMYRIGNFVIQHYTEMEKYDLNNFLSTSQFSESELLDFCKHFGIHSYDEFKEQLLADHQSRLEQIHARMLNLDCNQFIEYLNTSYDKEKLNQLIDELCDLIFKKKRIVIIGALYPSNVTVDFQTDLISLGKEVIEYHSFDTKFEFSDDDVVFFITATGKLMEQNVKKLKPQNICEAYLVLITQNIKYRQYENIWADYAIEVLGKYDGIQFNYQIMMIFDLLRIRYYQKYYR